MSDREKIVTILNQLMPTLQKEYYIKKIGLFGSINTPHFTKNSDVDLIVELEKPMGWKFFTLELYLEKMLGRKIDLVTSNALREPLKQQILSQITYIA